MDKRLIAFERLLQIMDELRDKCPWDKKQTIQSLRKLTVEEVYELSDAIIDEDFHGIREELGDIMMHLIFYSKIASEQNHFDVADVLNGVCNKLVFRHPHIYGNVQVEDENEVERNWEKLKLKEGRKSILGGVPNSPAMVKAQRIQDKVKQVGFDWTNIRSVVNKVNEEMKELQDAVEQNDMQNIENEMGDVFFALINYARHLGLDAEKSLELTNRKFKSRFQWMEQYAAEHQLNMSETSLEQMESWWQMAKKEELRAK